METLQFTGSNFPSQVAAFSTSLKQYVWLLLSHGTLILPPPTPHSALHFQALNLYQAIPFLYILLQHPIYLSTPLFYSILECNLNEVKK